MKKNNKLILFLVLLLVLSSGCTKKEVKESVEKESVEKEKIEKEKIEKEDIGNKEEKEIEEEDKASINSMDFVGMELYGLETNSENLKLLPGNVKAMASNDKYLIGIASDHNYKHNILYRSSNGGKMWTEVISFDKDIKGIHINHRNNIFVSTGSDRGELEDSELFYAKDLNSDFKKVLDIKSGISLNWNMASDSEGYMFLSEYGVKDVDNNPRRIYRSKDWGQNWEIVYEPEVRGGYHNHVIHIDKNDFNNVYQIIGDDVKYVLKSEDRGDSWTIVDEGYHPTSVCQIEDKLIYGLDAVPYSGFKTFDIEEDKVIRDRSLKHPVKGSIYDIIRIGDVLYAATTSYYYQDWAASIIVSEDFGDTWKVLAKVQAPEGLGVAFEHFIEYKGDLYIGGGYPIILKDEISWHGGTIKLKIEK